jgi:serine/threonine protein kinase
MLAKLQPGDRIAGSPYVIVAPIGEGGMGSVYEVKDTLLEIHRAIKFIDVEVEQGPKRDQAIAEVLKEGRVIAKLHRECPEHIVEVHSMGITADSRRTPYLVMELVRGATVSKVLKRQGGRLLLAKDVRQLAIETLAALVTVHENKIVHRDLKPANIMVEPIPGTEDDTRMKVIDFGITSEVGRRTMRRALTFKYGAPEQVHIEGKHKISAQTDLYALGVILFEAIAGRGPFDDVCRTPEQFILAHLQRPAPSIASVVPGIPREHARLIDSMLEKDPEKRPESARILGSKFSDLPWDFTTTITDDSQKTHENMTTVLASVVRAAVEKPQKKPDAKGEPAPPKPAPPPAASSEPNVSTTMPSPGVDPAARPVVVRERPSGSTIRMEPSAQLPSGVHGARTAPTATSPPGAAVRVIGNQHDDGGPNSNPHVVPKRPFFVNNTTPLAPELDTRRRKQSIFSLAWLRSRPRAVVVSVAVALACVSALAFVEVGILIKRRLSSPTIAIVSPTPIAPTVSVATSAPLATVATPSAIPIASAPMLAPSPVQTADLPARPTAAAPVAVQAKPPASRPSATTSARPDSADIMIDLGDGTKIPMHSQRKLPGSGL